RSSRCEARCRSDAASTASSAGIRAPLAVAPRTRARPSPTWKAPRSWKRCRLNGGKDAMTPKNESGARKAQRPNTMKKTPAARAMARAARLSARGRRVDVAVRCIANPSRSRLDTLTGAQRAPKQKLAHLVLSRLQELRGVGAEAEVAGERQGNHREPA